MTIYCEPEEKKPQLIGFYLDHSSTLPKREVVFLSENGRVKESPSYAGRVQISGSLASSQINVSVSQVRRTDTGLYTSRFIYKDDSTSQDSTRLFLHVTVSGVYI